MMRVSVGEFRVTSSIVLFFLVDILIVICPTIAAIRVLIIKVSFPVPNSSSCSPQPPLEFAKTK